MPPRRARALQNARRLWPYVLMAWERWQALSPEDKERYRQRAQEGAARAKSYAGRGRTALESARKRRR
jgi:hypothetical protein